MNGGWRAFVHTVRPCGNDEDSGNRHRRLLRQAHRGSSDEGAFGDGIRPRRVGARGDLLRLAVEAVCGHDVGVPEASHYAAMEPSFGYMRGPTFRSSLWAEAIMPAQPQASARYVRSDDSQIGFLFTQFGVG